MKFGTDIPHLGQVSRLSFSEVEVKVQGRNCSAENLPLVV